MKKVRITAIRKACYPDLMAKYENPIQHACDVEEGQVWIANGWTKPEGFCNSAWDSISAFVMTLAHGGGNFYDGWMKNPKQNHQIGEESDVHPDLLPGKTNYGT